LSAPDRLAPGPDLVEIVNKDMSAAIVEPKSLPDQSTRASRRAVAVWAATCAIALTIFGLVIAAPLMRSGGYLTLAAAIYKTFSFVCHQLPDRSFHVAGFQFAVCSRCTGLYSGFAIAALFYPLARSLRRTDTPNLAWLALATLPLVVDFSLGYFGIWQNTHLTRFVTGALLSSVAVLYIMPGLIDLSSTLDRFIKRDRSTSA
jgi:uncharacterized membrane protein